MTSPRIVDVSALAPYEISNRSPLFGGQVLMCVIEGTVLCMLIATYFYLRLGVDVWPGPGVELPAAFWPTIALIPLLLSCVGSYLASEAAKKGSRNGMVLGLFLNFVLACIFLAMRAEGWKDWNFTWESNAHGSIVWAIMFLHSYDVVADVLMTGVLIIIVGLNRCGPKQRIGVHIDSVIWYFLVGIWIPLYLLIYWTPRWIGAAK